MAQREKKSASMPMTKKQRDIWAAINRMTPAARDAFLQEAHTKAEAMVALLSDNSTYRTDIVGFARDVLHFQPVDYQVDILEHVISDHRVAVRGPHGLGKTAIASTVVLWGVSTFRTDVKIITTASAWRQLTFYLWPEIHKWADSAEWNKVGVKMRNGIELLSLSIKIGNRSAFAAASDDYQSVEGAHASVIIGVFDEAKAIEDRIWDALEGAFSTGDAYALAISTPGDTSGRFYSIHSRAPGYLEWWCRHVTLDEAIRAGRVSRKWADARKEQWGEKSSVYQNRVLGEFAKSGDDTVIPLAWIELSNLRWIEQHKQRQDEPPRDSATSDSEQGSDSDPSGSAVAAETSRSLGVDPARYGIDASVIAHMEDYYLTRLDSFAQEDEMQIAGRVRIAAAQSKTVRIGIDVIGVGAGVYDRLREDKFDVYAINAAGSAIDDLGQPYTDKSGELQFLNIRAAMWWYVRELLDPAGPMLLALPPDEMMEGASRLIGDLVAPRWTVTSKGLIQIESKDEIRKRLSRSTDFADALCHALWVRRTSKDRRRVLEIVDNPFYG